MGQQCWLEEHRRQSHLTRIGDRWPETGNAPNGLIEGRLRPNNSEHGLRSTAARRSTSTQMQRQRLGLSTATPHSRPRRDWPHRRPARHGHLARHPLSPTSCNSKNPRAKGTGCA